MKPINECTAADMVKYYAGCKIARDAWHGQHYIVVKHAINSQGAWADDQYGDYWDADPQCKRGVLGPFGKWVLVEEDKKNGNG